MSKTETKLPHGCGSLQFRGAVYWMIYSNEDGQKIQENTLTTDLEEATRRLAARVLPKFRARVALLERIARGKQEAPREGSQTGRGNGAGPQSAGGRQEQSARRGLVRADSASGRRGNRRAGAQAEGQR
jgi:hypothetical protein